MKYQPADFGSKSIEPEKEPSIETKETSNGLEPQKNIHSVNVWNIRRQQKAFLLRRNIFLN